MFRVHRLGCAASLTSSQGTNSGEPGAHSGKLTSMVEPGLLSDEQSSAPWKSAVAATRATPTPTPGSCDWYPFHDGRFPGSAIRPETRSGVD